LSPVLILGSLAGAGRNGTEPGGAMGPAIAETYTNIQGVRPAQSFYIRPVGQPALPLHLGLCGEGMRPIVRAACHLPEFQDLLH
jgi:hypothetical protein